MLQIEKGQDIKQELLQRYKTILPDELIEIWEDNGLARLMGGYNFKRFIQNLGDDYFLEKYFQIPQYIEAVNKLDKLEQDECFGYVPLLGLGGSEKVQNLNKVKIIEHIELISQLVGKIGMIIYD